MKKLLLFILALVIVTSTKAQTPTMEEKLYYTAKVWGFVKYYHSEVSTCQVNWDSVLMDVLPDVRSASNDTMFNDALMHMLLAAGPMDIATTALPDTLPAELKRNRDWSWISSPMLRSDVRTILDTIKNNFRPHPGCHVTTGTSYDFNAACGGFLYFPTDTVILNLNINSTYPSQDQRLMLLFTMWNITRYFNPYNYVLDCNWDTALMHSVVPFANAANYTEFKNLYLKLVASLDDAHVYGLSYPFYSYTPPGYYAPRIKLKHVEGKYVVVRSLETGIIPGDAIISIEGHTIPYWEDSLLQYYSAGSPWIKRRIAANDLLHRPTIGATINIVLEDSTGTPYAKTINTVNSYTSFYNDFLYKDYYPADSLNDIDWTIFDCNVGYMNFGNLTDGGTDSAYDAMVELPAIVIDIRNYPASGNAWALTNKIFDVRKPVTKLTKPDVNYPGTYYWQNVSMGFSGNPTPYYGRIVVIVDENTQSAAEYTTMMLRQHSDVIVVGSNTAGADGNITWIAPSSDFRFGWTSLGVYYPNGDSTQRIGIVPDSMAYPTREGIRNHRDYVLEKALAIAGCTTYAHQVDAASQPTINMYPNPASNKVHISISNTSSNPRSIVISDIAGKTMIAETAKPNNIIDTRLLQPGMYLVRVQFQNGQVATAKLTIH